jgi:hypothetical protein
MLNPVRDPLKTITELPTNLGYRQTGAAVIPVVAPARKGNCCSRIEPPPEDLGIKAQLDNRWDSSVSSWLLPYTDAEIRTLYTTAWGDSWLRDPAPQRDWLQMSLYYNRKHVVITASQRSTAPTTSEASISRSGLGERLPVLPTSRKLSRTNRSLNAPSISS